MSSINDLSKEILDKIFELLNSGDYLNFILTSRNIYTKCYINILAKKPVRLLYTGTGWSLEYSKQYKISQEFLDIYLNRPELLKQFKVLHFKNKDSFKISRKYLQENRKIISKSWNTPESKVKVSHGITNRLLGSLENFENLNYFKIDISDISYLLKALNFLPQNLKGLDIVLTENQALNGLGKKRKMCSYNFKMNCLKYIRVASIAEKNFIYGQTTVKYLRHIIDGDFNPALGERRIQLEMMRIIGENDYYFGTHQVEIKKFGELIANIINCNKDTINTIELSNIDAYVVFVNTDVQVRMPNLRVIRLCSESIPRFSWWSSSVATNNSDKRQIIRDLPDVQLVPVVVFFSDIFQKTCDNKSTKRDICKIVFMDRWWSERCVNMTGSAVKFWKNYCYY